jgi:hypothetical protein
MEANNERLFFQLHVRYSHQGIQVRITSSAAAVAADFLKYAICHFLCVNRWTKGTNMRDSVGYLRIPSGHFYSRLCEKREQRGMSEGQVGISIEKGNYAAFGENGKRRG